MQTVLRWHGGKNPSRGLQRMIYLTSFFFSCMAERQAGLSAECSALVTDDAGATFVASLTKQTTVISGSSCICTYCRLAHFTSSLLFLAS